MTISGYPSIVACPSTNVSGHTPTSAYPSTNVSGYLLAYSYPPINVSGLAPIFACLSANDGGHAPTSAYPYTIVNGHATIAAYPPRYLGGHAAIGNRVLLFRIRVNHYSENRLPLQIHHPFGDKVLCRSSEYSILQKQAFCRPSRCFLQSRKYSVALQSAQSCRSKHRVARHDALFPRSMTNLGQEWSFSDRRKYSVARQSTQSCRNEHPVGRHDDSSNCGSTLTAVTMLPPSAQILCCASEYSIF